MPSLQQSFPASRPRFDPELLTSRPPGAAHLVGICGSGMKALAELLMGLGWQVSGSDLQQPTPALQILTRHGLRLHCGHDEQLLPPGADVLVYSPAVGEQNPERERAARLGIPQKSYSQMLGHLMRSRTGVAITGTHGKSTTTAMTGTILDSAGFSPSVICGAELCDRGANGWAGEGNLFVVEGCEFQQSFLDLAPAYGAILSIEPDHFDCYAGLDETRAAFAAFARQIAADGLLLVRKDCRAAMEAARSASAETVTFSLTEEADWWASGVRRMKDGLWFRIFHRGQFFSEVSLPLAGEHNVLNALAAAGLCHHLGVPAADIRRALADFHGVRRRFEHVGSWRGVSLIDDYAHHPTAVRATLKTAREMYPQRRIWCAFQPHQVSRTVALMDEFATSFADADQILVAPVYAARERVTNEPELVSRRLAGSIQEHGAAARFTSSLDRIIATLEDEARPGDVLVTMGAGDIDRVHHDFTRRLQRHPATRRAAGAVHVAEDRGAGAVLRHAAEHR